MWLSHRAEYFGCSEFQSRLSCMDHSFVIGCIRSENLPQNSHEMARRKGSMPQLIGRNKDFLNRNLGAQTHNWHIGAHKVKRFPEAKETDNEVSKQPTNWKEIFASQSSNRLVSWVYKALNIGRTNNPIKNRLEN